MQDEKTITHFNFNVVLAKGIYVGHRKLNADQAPCRNWLYRCGMCFPWHSLALSCHTSVTYSSVHLTCHSSLSLIMLNSII